jgi:hypothetical protein
VRRGLLPLDRLQRWMHAVIVHPGSVTEALAAPLARSELPASRLSDVVLPSRRLAPAERLGIYHGMYLLRMEEALATDYPGLKHFLGAGGFAALVREYVQVYPSRSYTLNRLGDHLPEFIRNTRALRQRGFCEDLARLELAASEVFDEEETPPLAGEAIAAVAAEDWEGLALRPVAAFRLLTLGWNANSYLDSVRDEAHRHPRPRRETERVAVFRRSYAVYRLSLEPEAYALLAELAAGVPLGAAIAAALDGRRVGEKQLYSWFRQWVSGGAFRAIERVGA